MFKLFSTTEQTISIFYKLCAKLIANLLKSKQTYCKPEFPPAHNEQTNRKLQANCRTGSGPGLAAAGVSQALLCAGTGREGDRETPRCRRRCRSYCLREGSRSRGTARGGLSSCQHRSSGQGLAVGWAEHWPGRALLPPAVRSALSAFRSAQRDFVRSAHGAAVALLLPARPADLAIKQRG
jgi:hypothetical protein